MESIWGYCLTALGLIAWLGQLIYAISPTLGARLNVGEAASEVDAVVYIDARGEAIWDSLILWILPLAGVLLILQDPTWPYWALVGSGSYLYFSGRNLITLKMMQQRGIRIGTSNNIKIAYLFCSIWGLAALITIIVAITELSNT